MASLRSRTRAASVSLALLLMGCAHAAGPTGQGDVPGRATHRAAGTQSTTRAASSPFISPSSYTQLVMAELHASRNDLPGAIAAIQAAIELGENDPLLQARLAELQDRSGDHAGARQTLESALRSSPHSEALFRAAARIARARDQRAVALAAYERAEAFAESPYTALERIEYLRTLGSDERALAALEQLAVKHRSDVRACARLDLELAVERATDSRALVDAARDWLALGSSDPALSRRAARALLAQRRPQLALQLLDAVPTDEGNAALRMQALLALGRIDDCAHLLATTPPAWLGTPAELAAAKLATHHPEAALALLEEHMDEPQRSSIEAQALSQTLGERALPALARELTSANGKRAP